MYAKNTCSEVACSTYGRIRKGLCDYHYGVARRAAKPTPCSFTGCHEPLIAAGLCNKHYKRLRQHGDAALTFNRSETAIAQRFWAKVDASGDCWEWTGQRHRTGHGVFTVPGGTPRQQQAHRVSWEMHNGPIPEGMNVCHKCDNPPCIRPEHLFLGSQLDNLRDMIAKGRASWQRASNQLTPPNATTRPSFADCG